ncbi:class I SAM-dependent methyltransferase [Allokutzneria sp. A3M-2-11 16]|uniref:class I SAM-dependent methyltransferase n=1 Tax=Allokutzneria sp. A3M-2-11 16 TaxID=2962043 RepID=UPI0020B73306|nr:class I SAM-dependent methyltransferase [Allokutzneria sp. A3M-2-11 16]MCP3801912.1 class I SAM-dependent methyltransferase [Allokutzneria sp. A3M-2-11 16]
MREYRLWHSTTAQVSPPPLAWDALRLVRGATVADVGCGSGAYGYLLRAGWGHTESWLQQGITTPEKLCGLDNSRHATVLAERHRIYDRLDICSAVALTLDDDAVATAVCMETVEHLYPRDVLPALRELARIATERIVITTPAPEFIVDYPALLAEEAEAKQDNDFMSHDEYAVLESSLHKSWLDPQRMLDAGFEISGPVTCGSHIYHADPGKVDIEAIGEVPGIPVPETSNFDPLGDWRECYVALLGSVRAMAEVGR